MALTRGGQRRKMGIEHVEAERRGTLTPDAVVKQRRPSNKNAEILCVALAPHLSRRVQWSHGRRRAVPEGPLQNCKLEAIR
jgi:hypothetical protein